MENEVEIFELVIDDSQESGVDYIALVDHPAIESNWMAFSKQKHNFAIQDEEQRIVSGYFMKADLPIVRIDDQGNEFYVVFRKDTIKDIVFKYMQNGYNANTNLMHDPRQLAEGVYLFESLLIDSKRGIKAPEGFEDAPDGSWWGSMKVDNDEIWDMIKNGTFRGFSVEGIFKQSRKATMEQEIVEKIKDLLRDL
jgi:hypothetical protein